MGIQHLSLAGEWQVTWTDGLHGRPEQFKEPSCDPDRYLSLCFPGSIHSGLERAGLLDDPRLGLNSLKARWVEEQFWILRREFDLPDEAAEQPAYLHLGVIDGVAQVAVNGVVVGEHANAHRPADFALGGQLRPGRNEVSILLESGLFRVADLPGADYNRAPETLLNKRQHLRQAQYQFGWDWNPRLVFLGLHGSLEVVWGAEPWIKQVCVLSHVSEDLGWGRIRVRPLIQRAEDAPITTVTLSLLSWEGLCAETEVELHAGLNEPEVALDIAEPRLWWPRGHGEPFLYPLYLCVRAGSTPVAHWEGRTGLRRVTIDQSPHPETGQYFQLNINNRPVFCKGANWVPPELSAHEVTPAKVAHLVALAEAENMNTLRIWGGGVWANHTLLDLCDERGILVWHDLLFACSKYPADRPEFMAEAECEAAWGLREFSPHPSLAVWCGNNELEAGLREWGYKQFGRTAPDYALFHQVFPALAQQIDPTRPYWPSSPYSGPARLPSDPTVGDQHPWGVSLGQDDINIWAYRRYVDRFPNEGGVLGCASGAALRRFLGPRELKQRSPAWEHHDNAVEFWSSDPGTSYRLVSYWLGRDPARMDVDTYALASGLLQAEALKEYILNYRRRWPSSGAAIYWMFNDSWPTVHGWGTFDYDLNRKPAFHPVRRAFADLTVALADEGSSVGAYIINDTGADVDLSLELGTFTPQSSARPEEILLTRAAAFTSQCAARLPKDTRQIYYAVLRRADGILLAQDRMLLRPFAAWKVSEPAICVETVTGPGGRAARYTSPTWVWGVVLDPGGAEPAADDVFDLLPGVPYDVPLEDGEYPCRPVMTGSQILRG